MFLHVHQGIFLLFLCLTIKAQENCLNVRAQYNKSFNSTKDALIFLANLSPSSFNTGQSSSKLGHFSYEDCCRSAVIASVYLNDEGALCIIPNMYLKTTNVSELVSQFPCGAVYKSTAEHSSDVKVPYWFYKEKCGGSWQVSGSHIIQQWALPLVGFILPAVFFCYSVPRTYRLWIPQALFPTIMKRFSKTAELLYKIPLALILAILDNAILVSIVVTQAGPMILSGLHEAKLGNRVINYMVVEDQHRHTPFDSDIVRLLLIVLVSNLKLDPTWDKVDEVVEKFRIDRDRNKVPKMKNRLWAMLDSQMNFGLSVGAPAIYYVGAFIYTIIEMRASLGDSEVSQALAFGDFWMIVPHVAVVGSCLLGGNNPNTLQLLVADNKTTKDETTANASKRRPFVALRMNKVFARVYSSTYQPVAMWNRGKCTSEWLHRLICEYPEAYLGLKVTIAMSLGDWVRLNLMSCALIFIPCILGGITAFTTPMVGLSCRSLTILVYLVSQIILIILKNLEYMFWGISYRIQQNEWLDPQKRAKRHAGLENTMLAVWYFFYGLSTFTALFSAIGGTMLQLMGVYRNFFCSSKASTWLIHDSPVVTIPVGSNSADQQYYASKFWEPTGIAAVLFLNVICFGCWWYQTQLRIRYNEVVENSLHENPGPGQ